MDPGALVADVDHLEEVLIQPGLAQRVSEERLVGPGRTRRDENAVEVVLLDRLLDLLRAVGGAGVEVLLGIDDVRQGPGKLHGLGHVDDPADIAPAVADEHADPRLLVRDVLLGGILLGFDQGSPHVGKESHGPCGGAAGLHDGLGNVLRLGEGAADKHAGTVRVQWGQAAELAVAVLVAFDAEPLGHLGRTARRAHAVRKHHQVELLVHELALLVEVLDAEIALVVDLVDRRRSRPHEPHALVLGPLVVRVEAFPEGAQVHEEDGVLDVRQVLFDHQRVLDGVHAADGRAVVRLVFA